MNRVGKLKHGGKGTLTYKRWRSMRARCMNKKSPAYEKYRLNGITVCARWADSFPNFLADMGECPNESMTLDRINNNLGYTPENCRWATRSEQGNNKSNNRQITFNGKTQGVLAWSQETGIKQTNILNRLYMGWSVERTLTTVKDARAGRTIYRKKG